MVNSGRESSFCSTSDKVSFFQSLGVRRPLTFHTLIFSSENAQPNEPKLDRIHLWIRPDRLRNMVDRDNSSFWLVDFFKKMISSEPIWLNEPKPDWKHVDGCDFLPKYTQIHPNIPKYSFKLYYFYYFEMLYE